MSITTVLYKRDYIPAWNRSLTDKQASSLGQCAYMVPTPHTHRTSQISERHQLNAFTFWCIFKIVAALFFALFGPGLFACAFFFSASMLLYISIYIYIFLYVSDKVNYQS